MVKGDIITPNELDASLISQWRSLLSKNAALDSPFYAPEFTQALGAARHDARIAILQDGGEIVGFLPFHKCRAGVAKPIGGQLSDYQGIIAAADHSFDASELLAACRLNAYDFNHAPVIQDTLRSGAYHFSSSPYMALTEGFEAYRKGLPQKDRMEIKNSNRRRRKIEREIGELRFVANDRDDAAWTQLMAWKRDSFAQMGVHFGYDTPWVASIFQHFRTVETAPFAGLMSSLYAGGRLVAAHFGIRSQTVWHWWFSSYDTALSKYGPGLLLILEAARLCPEMGVSKIDFGRGDQHYKLVLANGRTELCEGSIVRSASRAGVLRGVQKSALRLVSNTPLKRYESLARRASSRFLTSMRLREGGEAIT